MAFAQLTWRESLRDIEASLSANAAKLYAMGFRSPVKRSTLADANELRDWRIWADLAALLIRRARKRVGQHRLHQAGAFFVTRAKSPMGFKQADWCAHSENFRTSRVARG